MRDRIAIAGPRTRGAVGRLPRSARAAGLETAEAVLRAGLLRLGGGMLGGALSAGPGYRGPRVDCGHGHQAVFTGYREKVIDTVLGPVTLRRAWYHCADCGHGLAPRDAELGAAGGSMSPGLRAMSDKAAAAVPCKPPEPKKTTRKTTTHKSTTKSTTKK